MKNVNIIHIVGLVVINSIILWFERPPGFKGWRLYVSMMFLLAIASLAPLMSFLILIPITTVNVLMNSNRIQELIRGE